MLISYFAYGSNMDERDMRERCPSVSCLGSARLDDHRLAFTRRSVLSGTGVADVAPAPNHTVWGVLYELDGRDLDVLDRKEGRGWAYTREKKLVTLCTDGSSRDALVYTVIEKEQSEVPPSREYLDRLLAAAERHALPREYVTMLRDIPS